MKEMMIKLPVIEVSANENLCEDRLYPKSGRYIIAIDNGDVLVVDAELKESPDGVRSVEETCSHCFSVFLGQPQLLDPQDFVSKEKLAQKERDCDDIVNAVRAEANDIKKHYEERKENLREEMDAQLALRRAELENEFKIKDMQLQLDTPKRFGQGEWVSGKTLKEIVEVLAGSKNKE